MLLARPELTGDEMNSKLMIWKPNNLTHLFYFKPEGTDVNVLGEVQVVQGLREQLHGVIDQGSLSLGKGMVG